MPLHAAKVAVRAVGFAAAGLACGLCLAAAPLHTAEAGDSSATLEVADYFDLQRVSELALSGDGKWLAYISERATLGTDSRQRTVQIVTLPPNVVTVTYSGIDDARQLAWIPGTQRLAFLASDDGVSQVFSVDPSSGDRRRHTAADDSVESYRFAPDGRHLAYLTRLAVEPGASLYQRFREDTAGILVDPSSTSSHDFLNPHWHGMVKRPPARLHVLLPDGTVRDIDLPGDPAPAAGGYHWSSDSRLLSVLHLADELEPGQLRGERTSLGIVDLQSGRFTVLAKAVEPQGTRPGQYFQGGEWVPDTRRLLVRRVTEVDPWNSDAFPEWAIVEATDSIPQTGVAWYPVETYPRDLQFLPVDDSRLLVENTREGVHSLFTVDGEATTRSPIVEGLEGSSSKFRFSADRRTVVFLHESLTEPPEIYLQRGDAPATRVTTLNGAIAARVRHTARAHQWRGADGTTVSGWLLEPVGAGTGPWPLITHVHGGPAYPYPNAFAPYFNIWPYPFEVLAASGFAIFFPNYRGTHTYGRAIADADGDAPVQDIVAGIDALIRNGVGDSDRLGITGHSHGAWLGPMVMAHYGAFRASSFAEGVASQVVMYELMSGDANREIHDPIIGSSLYETPEKYLEGSPNLHFAGLTTASLFEAGAYTAALYMLGFPKAAQRAGMPTEFIVYPQTQHNLASPRLQKESAVRNIDWFEFWLRGREDPDPAKTEQYERWRAWATQMAKGGTAPDSGLN